ncbi:flagellar hook-length control protein FliK [Vibrio gazogenes]|uniref:Flagellar hook-length control protein FliK n=1 Tax=Vibrio gazogenes DSM 21264 = NBRC 103151 TaxID=1123492 RepID=A0A1M4XLW4_VIBGA|nr:flagellar hook-length control protein FliK [Vibrio gazogenes]USP12947.1 flagellar hook-length control protein FliK [Vibrio gazogenes]SHE94495.1 flagellar hook-length control protein FliK [Vibrio gazogenes DSM 21264] [Vibrio gazogenes DSM 21264 = NBRC 103151]SJN54907.1 Flagellar hook-length control protein [Vibrio gazogenes]
MNINLTPTSGTQKAQSHHKAVSDDAVVGDVAESSQESGGFFAKLAALFKGDDSASGKPSSIKSGEAKPTEGVSDVAGDMSADALLSDPDISGKDISDKEVSGKESSKAEFVEVKSQKNLSENVGDLDLDNAQIAAAKTSGGQHQPDGDTAALNPPRPESNTPPHATTSSSSSLKSSEQSDSSAQKGDSSAQKDAALRTMGEGEAVLSRLKGAEQQLVSQNGNKLPASDDTQAEGTKHVANTVQQVNVIDPDTLQDTAVSSALSLPQVEPDSDSSQTQSKGSDEHQLTGDKALTADLSQLPEASAQQSGNAAPVVSSEVQTKDTAHRKETVSPEQILAGANIQSVSNQNITGQADVQNVTLTDDVEHTQAAVLSGTEGNTEKAVLSQKLLQSLNQELPPRADPRHHTHMAQQQFAAQQLSQVTPVPVNPLTQAIQSDGSTNSLMHLPGDSIASQAALQTLSASAVGREQWIRQRLAGLGDSKVRPEGMIDDGTGKEGHFAHQLSSLAGQQSPGVQSHIRADVAQTPTSIYLAKDAMAADQLSERVQMMMSKNLKNIDIRLDPPELGRMHIRMNMSGDAATVHFTVATPQAREALEHSMPRLRDMLSQQGVQLGETSVQHQGSGHQQPGYAASGQGQSSGQGALPGQDSVFHDDNPDTGVKLDMNVSSKRDGISYYA